MERIPEPSLMHSEEQCRIYSECIEKFNDVQGYVEMYSAYMNLEEGLIADLGSGDCQFVIGLAKKFPNLRFHCYELSDAMTAIARTKIKESGLEDRITLIKEDALEAKGTYDLVTANRFLHHTTDVPKFWETASKIGKKLFVTDPIRPDTEEQLIEIINSVESLFPQQFLFDFNNTLYASYTIPEVRAQVSSYGYSVNEVEGYLIVT